jgi:uncharacterized membrane protein
LLDGDTLLAILGMAVGTYACRAGGYWLFRQIRPTPFIRGLLEYLPGTLFVSYVVPGLLAGGLQQWLAGAATAAVIAFTRNFALAIAAGAATAWLVWWLT